MKEENRLRCQLITVCRRLEQKGLVAAADGNVSCRVGQGRLLITPSGRAKGDLQPLDLLLVDDRGEVLAGAGRPSSEIRLHLLVYEKRPDVQAVVHAHPPMLTAMTLAGIPFPADALPEVWMGFGPVPTAPYATPCTREVPESIAPFVEDAQAVLLARHGSLTVGRDLGEACARLEKLEHAAHTLFYAHLMQQSPPEPLAREDLQKLDRISGRR